MVNLALTRHFKGGRERQGLILTIAVRVLLKIRPIKITEIWASKLGKHMEKCGKRCTVI